MSEVGKEIRRRRKERGWSQAQLAVYAGSSQPTVNQIESGVRNPSTRTLEKIAQALGVEARDLFPLEQAPLWPTDADVAAREMEEVLQEVRENMATLRSYFENPPDEEAADEAAFRFHELMPRPVELLVPMDGARMRRYAKEVAELLPEQLAIRDRIGPWNAAQYGHLHRDHA